VKLECKFQVWLLNEAYLFGKSSYTFSFSLLITELFPFDELKDPYNQRVHSAIDSLEAYGIKDFSSKIEFIFISSLFIRSSNYLFFFLS